jgi:hypothetical protein
MSRTLLAGLRVDYIGFALLTLGVSALQIMLDKGQEDDWFSSHFIITLAAIAAVCLPALVIYEWFQRDPLIDVRLFTNRNFATANLMMFLVGANSLATTVLVPHDRGVHRHLRREEQLRRRARQLHAQHWQQRRHVDRHDADRAAVAIPPGPPGVAAGQRQPLVSGAAE